MTRQDHIEAVAEDLHAHDFPRTPWNEVEEVFKKQWRSRATAAITALERAGAYVGEK